MAKVLPNGLFSGRVGNLIYYVVDGVQYAKIYKSPTDPKTKKQLRHRAMIRDNGKFFKQFKEVIDIGYQSAGTPLKIFNAVAKYHMEVAMEETTPSDSSEYSFRVIPEKVKLADGIINEPEILKCQRNGQEIDLKWNPALGNMPNRFTDALAVVAYTEGETVHADFHAGIRKQGTSKVVLPSKYANPVHLWVFFWNGEKSPKPGKDKVSGSVYLGIH